MARHARATSCLTTALLLGAPAAYAQAPAPTPARTVAALAWLAGCWEQRTGGERVEEQWLAPRGGVLVGLTRTTDGDSTTGYEYMRVHRRGGTLVFDAQPSGRPPTSFPATAVGAREVTFANDAHDFPQRIRYRAVGADSLHARIDGVMEGRPVGMDFRYARTTCAASGTSAATSPPMMDRAASATPAMRRTPAARAATAAFQRLLDDHWQWVLRWSPVLATTLGERRHDREIGDLTVGAMDVRTREAAAFHARAGRLDTLRLTAGERVSLAVLRRSLAEDIEGNRFGQRTMLFTTYASWHTGFADLPDRHPFRERADYEAYVARLAAFPRYNRGGIETTRAAIAGGFLQPCTPFAGYERTMRDAVSASPDSSRFLQPFARRPAYYDAAAWTALRARAAAIVRDSVHPAYTALLAFYQQEYVPRCRATDGIAQTADGAAYHAFRVRSETTTDLTPEAVHQLGLREVARIGALMDSVAARAGFADRKAFIARLRTDPAYYARTPEELLAAASMLAKRIDGEMPKYFGTLPRLPYTVRPIPDAIAPGTTTAYYSQGSLEGGRPGTYWVNTSKLDQRPLYELPSLTMHEAVPGHHHQIALAQELALPVFRRYGTSFAAFTEGWGLYAETLGREMGLYDTPAKEMGRLSYEMWRACRLVVDPGIHAKGWTRDQAIAYMMEQTALSRGNIEAEVNRYISWPGQATAYKVGELRIRALREEAERRLGSRFDLRAFHDAVLENGPVPLDVLEAHVQRWMAQAARGGDARSTGGR